jgi:predicted DNA-binding protein
MWKSFRLSNEEREKLEEMATHRGMTVSDVIRDMIRQGHQQHVLTATLEDFRKQHSQEIARLRAEVQSRHKGDTKGNQDLTEIKHLLSAIDKRTSEQQRIITLLGQASPFVSKQLGHQ